jgi:hypothetical protein
VRPGDRDGSAVTVTEAGTPFQAGPAAPARPEFEDFDAYWEQRERARRPAVVRVRGIDVEAPSDLPVEMQLRADQVAVTTMDEVRDVLETLLGGGDVVDELVEAGIGMRELQLLTTWATAHGSGQPVTLAEADDLLTQAEAGEAGKPRAQRRAQARATRSGGRSGRTGR